MELYDELKADYLNDLKGECYWDKEKELDELMEEDE